MRRLVGFGARKTQVQILTLPPAHHVNLVPPAGKGHLVHAIFPPLLGHVRVGLEPGTLPCQEVGSPFGLCWIYHLVWGCLSLL